MEITLAILGTFKTSSGFKRLCSKRSFDEFKREAFKLFEDLLNKIKIDFITFLK